MFILGLCALFQITFLPGILILQFYNLRKGFIQSLVSAFGLSLIANHLLVFLITSLRLNISIIFYLVFALEIMAALWLGRARMTHKFGEWFQSVGTHLRHFVQQTGEEFTQGPEEPVARIYTNLVVIVLAILVGSSIWWAIRFWLSNIDTVFIQWDAIISWNHWATEWFAGQFPAQTSQYPQLIPSNFAVTYAFLQGTQVQIFAKSFMPLFNIFILLMMLDLALETRNRGYLLGILATRFIIKKFLGEYISSGYVDVALACFALLPIYILLKAQNASEQDLRIKYLWLGGVLAAGAALTKQNGLLILAVYPLLAYTLVLKDCDRFPQKEKIISLIKIFLVSLAIILPWYGFNQVRLMMGTNGSNLAYLMGGRHEGRDLVERAVRAIGMLEEYAFLYPLILILLPFVGSTFRWISLTILLPYSLIWVFFFSTFTRNLSLALPYLGMLTGISVQYILDRIAQFLSWLKLSRLKNYWLIFVLIVALLAGSLVFTRERILARQTIQQKEIIISAVNHKIYDYFDKTGRVEPIMTNYPVEYLPGLEEMQIDIGNFGDYDYYWWVKKQHPEARLMLIYEGRASDTVLQEVLENIEKGNYELIFKQNNYLFVRIIKEGTP